MLLEADTLVYDNDKNTVTAVGGVRIDYGGNRLVANRVVYDRKTGRVVASGNVQIIDSSGTKIYSEEIDITDDFSDGFANALRVETTDKTYFAAESAERKGANLTTFNNGVYTACAPCEKKPDRAPIWRVKAQKIIWDGKAKTVRFESSRFELFGLPIAYFPAWEVPDPTVKRKSGFLLPGIAFKSDLGVGVSIPYYFALSPTYDLTVTGRYYSKQGFLGQAEWRQRFNNGFYSLKTAGIYQQDPEAFDVNTIDSGRPGDPNHLRGMVGSKGLFNINPRWTFGWDVLAQSDKDFSNMYQIGGYEQAVHQSEVFLTGLNDRNYFDLRAMHFDVQEIYFNDNPLARQEKQPWVLPTFDYAYTPDEPIAGGELNVNVNARQLNRNEQDLICAEPVDLSVIACPNVATNIAGVRGIKGSNGRVTAEAEWKKSIVAPGGMVITPLLALRSDASYSDVSDQSLAAIQDDATTLGVGADVRSEFYRYMATAGLEWRWPVLFSSVNSTHVIEPMAQVFARPNEQDVSELGIPNEDAQSFVFDASSLFDRDKFSGYDRIEGGTRVNVGVRYSGAYSNGVTTNAIFGQSYQVAGENSFAAPDLVNAGAFSGLQTPTSDYVGLVGFATPFGLSSSVSARFNEQNFDVERTELKAGLVHLPVALTAKYAFIAAQPLYGFPQDRHEATLAGSLRFLQNWRVFASGTYDLVEHVVTSDSAGFAYDDECFSYSMTYSQTRDRITQESTTSVGFNVSFRTIGDFGTSSNTFAAQ
ncbi:LPS-assembly protein LptD [Mesorhizobium sp. BAC0120]|uniref:LPS-assembly protein LptD n=1 Tax=Mesorhizobium sp. BAC0120 TaxID=3090670 RepID=UPI00298CF993|nr:LPS-assembly protein LptD [Mesorhizobium sp. BAC0120]MDW6021276.1 LPS-assembly protein LptD [Mesorhizobium sp. BAC0120]